MTPHPFTTPWADGLRQAINEDRAFLDAASDWSATVVLVLDATPDHGYPEATAAAFTLADGRCAVASLVELDAERADFVLQAPYRTWKKIFLGTLDPVMAVAFGQVRLTGSLADLMMRATAAKALLACARTVPVRFPDETS